MKLTQLFILIMLTMLSHSAVSYGYTDDKSEFTAANFDKSSFSAFIESAEFDDDIDEPSTPFFLRAETTLFSILPIALPQAQYIAASVYRLSIRAPPQLFNS